jgi:glycosyltransferase involved in cell wall biosynthesis
MKIGFITPEYPSKRTGNSGGIGTSIKNLITALEKFGHVIHVFIFAQNKDDIFREGNITFHQIKNKKFKGLSWLLTRKKIQNYIDDLYEKGEIDIVEAPDWIGITSFIQPKKCPVVIRLNGSDTYFCKIENRKLKYINYLHERRALKKADGHISVSDYTAKKTNEFFDLDINFSIIPNSIDSESFEANNETSETKNILYLGTLIRKKGLLDLPIIFNKVIEKHPNAILTVVGGDSVDILTEKKSTWELMKPLFSEEAFIRVNYEGKVAYNEVQNYINKADVCVFPSYAEAFPVSWLEAMAMGKAIVASNIGWSNEVIENGKSGYLAHPNNHSKFAEYIIKLIENPQLKFEFGTSAKNRIINNFDNKIIANKSTVFYQKIINQKKMEY